jgi:hypothetical protein
MPLWQAAARGEAARGAGWPGTPAADGAGCAVAGRAGAGRAGAGAGCARPADEKAADAATITKNLENRINLTGWKRTEGKFLDWQGGLANGAGGG